MLETCMPVNAVRDAIIVGARCAGAATALLLARSGARVLLLDSAQHGADTLSTHALMRGGVMQLARWGVLGAIRAAGTPTVRATSFHYQDDVIEVAIKPQGEIDGLYAPRRTVIDRVLADAAREAGAELRYGARVQELVRGADGGVSGVVFRTADGQRSEVRARLVIGADGMRSTLAELVGARVYRAGRHAACTIFGYWADTGLDGYHWHYAPGVSAGAIATNDAQVCVFASAPGARFEREARFDVGGCYRRVLQECSPTLAATLEGARMVGSHRAFPGLAGFFRQSFGPGWALVGDAGYFKDPITAHGITDALIDAEVLARAIGRGGQDALADYQQVRDERALRLFEITDEVASFDWDMTSVRELHQALSREMKREGEIVQGWGADGSPARLSAAPARST
jgi:2-polyprenyl-6-methoxyphenol hydroxylase-like FAD-dependent oxidoreductase